MLGLEYIRKLHDDTIVTLADKLGITNALISQWENGKKPIPDKRLNELSKLYNVKIEYFTKELTKLEQLHLKYNKLSDEYDKTIIEYETAVDYDENGIPRDFITEFSGDNGILEHMRILETEIKIEETLQEVRYIIDNVNSDYSKPFGVHSIIDTRETNIKLIHKFNSLMKENDAMFLAYILRAVELSNDDSWGENPRLDRNGLTGKLLKVITEWKENEKKRQEAEYQEYKELFGLDDESEET